MIHLADQGSHSRYPWVCLHFRTFTEDLTVAYAIHMQRASTQYVRCVASMLYLSFPSPCANVFIRCSDPDSGASWSILPHHVARDFLAVRIALTATSNEHQRPSLEARSSCLLFCESTRDAIN
jgi:hypothetical protein